MTSIDNTQNARKLVRVKKVGKRLYAVSGRDEITLYDGTKVSMNPSDAQTAQEQIKEVQEYYSKYPHIIVPNYGGRL